MHRALLTTASALAIGVLGCAKHSSPASAPPLSHVDAPEVSDGETPTLWREGTPGAILLFVRNVMSEPVQDTAEDLVDDFVGRCSPEYDAIAVVEPGIAAAIPNIHDLAAKELARRQRWRARCLERSGLSAGLAEEESKHQIQLVIDERSGVRHEVLGGADPGGDIVVAAFGARGEPVYRTSVKGGASYAVRSDVVRDAIRAVRDSSRAPEPRASR